MKSLGVILIVALAGFVWADEVVVSIDRVAFLVPPQDQADSLSSRVAVYFNVPDEVLGKDIIYAELHVALNFADFRILGDSILEFQARDITTNWMEDANWSSPWSEPGGDVDTLSLYTYTIRISAEPEVFLDLTSYVRSVAQDGRTNYGVMLMPYKYDLPTFHLPENLVRVIREAATVRIVYD